MTTQHRGIYGVVALTVVAISLLAADRYAALNETTHRVVPTGPIQLTPDVIAKCGGSRVQDAPVVEGYWPPGTFSAYESVIYEDWYSTQLCAMDELPLEEPGFDVTHIRFLWLRSFDPGVAIRVKLRGKEGLMSSVQLDGAGGYAPGSVSNRVELDHGPDAGGGSERRRAHKARTGPLPLPQTAGQRRGLRACLRAGSRPARDSAGPRLVYASRCDAPGRLHDELQRAGLLRPVPG